MTNLKRRKKKSISHFLFPISNKVYHLHPVAFVEQMKRYIPKLDDDEKMKLMMIISEFEGKFHSCNKDSEFSMSTTQLSYVGVVHIGLSWGFIQFTQDSGSLGIVLQKMKEKNIAKFEEVFGDNYQKLIDVTNLAGLSGQDQYEKLTIAEKQNYRTQCTEIFGPRLKEIATEKSGSVKKHIWKSPWVEKFVNAGSVKDFQEAQIEVAIDKYLNPALDICKEHNLCSELAIAIAFDRTVNQGKTGANRFFKKYVDNKNSKT